MTPDRRALLVAAATVPAAALAAPALAQAPAPAAPAAATVRQAPGFYRLRVGEAEITVLHDGFVNRRAEGLVRNAPLGDVEAVARAQFLDPNAMDNPYNVAIVRMGGRTTLIDSGFADNGPATAGQMAANMAAAGIDPASVNDVLVTHFHGDHISGIRKRDGSLTYPNARIHAPADELAFWLDDARMNAAPENGRAGFMNARRVFNPILNAVNRFDGERELVPGITSIPTKGHSPGHHSFVVSSGNAKILIQGDVTGMPTFFVRNPGWHSMFDMDAGMAEATRRRLYDMLAAERMPVIGYHFPFPAVGHVAKDGTGYRLELVHWRSAV